MMLKSHSLDWSAITASALAVLDQTGINLALAIALTIANILLLLLKVQIERTTKREGPERNQQGPTCSEPAPVRARESRSSGD